MISASYNAIHNIVGVLILFVIILLFSGCATPMPAEEQLSCGLIWMFPGVEGGEWLLNGPRRAFRDAGVKSAIYTHKWRYPLGILPNLMDHQANSEDAVQVAERIDHYQQQYPGRPIDLVGYSGGGGIAIMVAERLPENVRLRNVVLIHPAVSCDYDLTKVLSRIDGKLVNFCSSLDWFMVGVGTWLFGTIDRVHTVSAGKDGFNIEVAISKRELRDRFEQIHWSKRMFWDGHLGGHATIRAYKWTRRYIAPYLFHKVN